MEHSFKVNIAVEYGVHCAVLLNHIEFWITKNKANNMNYFDGHYWTYNSKKAYAELFPYLNERQIDYALHKLIDNGILITGNYNTNAYDRTLWYAITKKGYSILQNCEMEATIMSNGNNNIVEPIPYINTDIKPNKKTNKDNSGEALTDERKKTISIIVDYLNFVLGTNYKATSKDTRQHINARLDEGHTLDEFKTVIKKKHAEWGKDPKMCKFLRPMTLFGTKFESYLNQVGGATNIPTYEESEDSL